MVVVRPLAMSGRLIKDRAEKQIQGKEFVPDSTKDRRLLNILSLEMQ